MLLQIANILSEYSIAAVQLCCKLNNLIKTDYVMLLHTEMVIILWKCTWLLYCYIKYVIVY